MLDTTLTLIAYPRVQNKNGVWQDGAPVRRTVLAQMETVSLREFFGAGQMGIRPEYKFLVFAAEWQGERECEYCGQRLEIYRTYQPNAYTRRSNATNPDNTVARVYRAVDTDRVELYAGTRVGIHGTQ